MIEAIMLAGGVGGLILLFGGVITRDKVMTIIGGVLWVGGYIVSLLLGKI